VSYYPTPVVGRTFLSDDFDFCFFPRRSVRHEGDAGGQVPLSPLPTAQDSPPANTEAVVMTNEDAPTDPAPPTQM